MRQDDARILNVLQIAVLKEIRPGAGIFLLLCIMA